MRFFYTAAIYLYTFAIHMASPFSRKARQWSEGRKGWRQRLKEGLEPARRRSAGVVWFHVSSLGEFEQGRPVIEAIKARLPETEILLTFFSPSGYEVRKNYTEALYVGYLPADTPRNAREFLEIADPVMIFFVKYDFWFNYLDAISRKGKPLYYISSLFRPGQHFFGPFGGWARRHLSHVTHFFVQNRESEELLRSAGISRVTLAGDTRFDRVYALAMQNHFLPLIERFCGDKKVFVAGSCWPPDEEVFLPLIGKGDAAMKFILAPHETGPERIKDLTGKLNVPYILYSDAENGDVTGVNVMVIDCIGVLSRIYRYATAAFIGGGFGSGLHNIQEPVTYGVPVFFGPGYHKFREAADLVTLGGAFPVSTTDELEEILGRLISDPGLMSSASNHCRQYVEENRGATEKILRSLGI